MGTQYRVRFNATREAPPVADIQQAVDERLADINQKMSTYLDDSELSRFNADRGTEWFEVSPETAHVVGVAIEIADQTGGALDVTVGPAVNLWGFGPKGRRDTPPSEEEIAAVLQRIGYQKVQVRQDPPALRKSQGDVYVDLSAVAKGYAVDAVGRLLDERGIDAYMVEIGGEVVTRGTKPDGTAWRIGLENPDEHGRSLQMVIESSGGAIATSGDYHNFFESEGRRYSHTIDPATGCPVTHDLATVTVRADSCIRADSLATALLVMGPERGYDWAEAQGVAALFIRRAEEGFEDRSTSAWKEMLKQPRRGNDQ